MMNEQERFYLGNAVKSILVQMAIDSTLPSDMNDIDMDGIIKQAELNLSNDEFVVRMRMLNKLAEYVSFEDFGELNPMLDTILNHPNQNDCVFDIEGITPIASLEYSSMTVEALLTTIS